MAFCGRPFVCVCGRPHHGANLWSLHSALYDGGRDGHARSAELSRSYPHHRTSSYNSSQDGENSRKLLYGVNGASNKSRASTKYLYLELFGSRSSSAENLTSLDKV
eukprot:4727097-Pyramimonas_sp.AAC.1